MHRREFLKGVAASALLPFIQARSMAELGPKGATSFVRVRPGDPGWPTSGQWNLLRQAVGGNLIRPTSPFSGCTEGAPNRACSDALKQLGNPFYIGDQPALTQTSGWLHAWTSRPSVYCVEARSAADVEATVRFARRHRLRLVVKGGGHSYQGTSDSDDSLLLWTRRMNAVTLHDDFVPLGCARQVEPVPAVSLEAGAMWIDAYTAVTTRAGRYVQGGGCTSVGVAGLIQSGGFGSFSKRFGTAAASLMEAEIVTAEGQRLVANPSSHPDLFWAIKGGGGGTLGVVTRLTLRTHELPTTVGIVVGKVQADSDQAYRALIAEWLSFYRESLLNPHWGEQIHVRQDNALDLMMVFQGLDRIDALSAWQPFLDWIGTRKEYRWVRSFDLADLPGQHLWDSSYLRKHAPNLIVPDSRPDGLRDHYLWAADQGQVGWFVHGFGSAWLPERLLGKSRLHELANALVDASRHHDVALHFNKGLAGAPAEAIAASRDTAMNPAVLQAFALAIISSGGPPAFPGMPGIGNPNTAEARSSALNVGKAMDVLLKIAPSAGAYMAESDYFQRNWREAFWGSNYPRLAAVKKRYDPDGLFFAHHGIGSDRWSADGFTRVD